MNKKALSSFLFKNYIVISCLLVCAFVLSLFTSDFLVDIILFKGIRMEDVKGEDIYSYPFETMDTEILDAYGGWYEILDEERKVIFVKGEKKDNIYQYSDRILFNKIDLMKNMKSDDNLLYHVYPASGPSGQEYLLLWKQPKNLLNYTTKALIILIVNFSILLLIALYFYSVYSVKQIKKPLKKIVHGIKEMERQNYKIRLDFATEQEFAEIRDAFNKMAEKLEQSNIEKERVEEAKKRMLLHLSHDLKTPITSIYGFSKLLHEDDIKEEIDRKKYTKYIHDKSLYVANLLKDLFEFAKLEENSLRLNKEKVNITEWLRQTIIELYTEIEENGLSLEIKIPEEKIDLKIDSMKMKRVITNIINNSIKYNLSGTIIYVECSKIDNDVLIAIGDNGIGIDENMKNIIFDDFITGKHESKDGTGLGLAISKKIVTLHNGEIALEEDEKYKTKFTIRLPIK